MVDVVTLATFREPQEAHMFASRLRSEGLFASVAHQFHVGNDWWYSTALSGVKVQVAASDLEAAQSIEKACRAGEFKQVLISRLGELDDSQCPKCGAADFRRHRPIYQCVIAGLTVLFSRYPMPPCTWIYTCKTCGTEFKQRYGLIGKAKSFPFEMAFAGATAADIDEMLRVRDDADENGVILGALDIEDLSEARRAWVCRINGTIRAFAIADANARTLSAVAVDLDFQRYGIGQRLHNFAVDWLFRAAPATISLKTSPYTKAYKFFGANKWKFIDADEQGDYLMTLEHTAWRLRRRQLHRTAPVRLRDRILYFRRGF